MESRRSGIICHACNAVQRDHWAYRNHLLRVHGEVIRGGTNIPVRLEGRELETVWSADYRHLLNASHRKEAMGLPRVADQEAARHLHENRARRARRSRAAARAARQRAARPMRAPTTHVVPHTLEPPAAATDRHVLLVGSQPASSTTAAPTRTYSLCDLCLNCPCRRPKYYSAAQDGSPSPPRCSRTASRCRLSPQRPPPRAPSPGPPQLWREAALAEGPTHAPTLSWDDAQAEFSLGAETMSQGSGGSPVNFMDLATPSSTACVTQTGTCPTSIVHQAHPLHRCRWSSPEWTDTLRRGPPSPATKQTATYIPVADAATQVLSRPHQGTVATQTPTLVARTQD